VATQLALTWWLWRALYTGVTVSAGLDVTQATTYALLGVLYLQFRSVDRWSNGDTMVQLMLTARSLTGSSDRCRRAAGT
jgi:hypothetical protein